MGTKLKTCTQKFRLGKMDIYGFKFDVLFSLQEVDSGMYTCVATSAGGNTGSATVTVEVDSESN